VGAKPKPPRLTLLQERALPLSKLKGRPSNFARLTGTVCTALVAKGLISTTNDGWRTCYTLTEAGQKPAQSLI
jgi:hypothetical protein